MSANTKPVAHLTLVASDAWYWERPGVLDNRYDSVQRFAADLYHDHPQDVDGLTHREENAVYHIIQGGEYRTLPAGQEIETLKDVISLKL